MFDGDYDAKKMQKTNLLSIYHYNSSMRPHFSIFDIAINLILVRSIINTKKKFSDNKHHFLSLNYSYFFDITYLTLVTFFMCIFSRI